MVTSMYFYHKDSLKNVKKESDNQCCERNDAKVGTLLTYVLKFDRFLNIFGYILKTYAFKEMTKKAEMLITFDGVYCYVLDHLVNKPIVNLF